jgi:hypothetical protein
LQLELAQEIGTGLFDQLFTGDTKRLYERALGPAGPDHGLRIDLNLTAVPDLMDLPWQFEGYVWGAPVMVRGIWQVYGNQLDLRGVRMAGGPFPQHYPYGVLITFGSWNNQQMARVTTAGENVFWNRQG